MPQTFIKSPGDELNYGVDWSGWLEAGDTITASTWTVPTDLTASSEAVLNGTEAVVTLAGGLIGGGAPGIGYTVTNLITTANGLVEQRSIKIFVLNR